MEAANVTVDRPCPFREQGYTVATTDKRLKVWHKLVYAHRDGEVFGMTDDEPVKWIMPCPVVGQEDDAGRERKQVD